MKTIAALFVAVLVLGIVPPAHALPNQVQGNGVVYAANNLSGRVSKIDLPTLELYWATSLATPTDVTELSLNLAKGVLYVTGKRVDDLGIVWALDADTGAILWQTTMPGGAISSSATVDKGTLFVAGAYSISALDAETGQILWQSDTGLPVPPQFSSSPTVYKNVVVVVSDSGPPPVVATIDARTGQVLSVVPLP